MYPSSTTLRNPPDCSIKLKLAELSKKAHALAKRYYEQKGLEIRKGLRKGKKEIDRPVTELYGITAEELEEVRRTLRVLKGVNSER